MRTETVPDEGTPVGAVPPEVAVAVVVPPPLPLPDFGRYLIPLDGQLPGVKASILTKEPSMTDPCSYGTSRTLEELTERIVCKIDTHVVEIVDLVDRAVGLALEADLEAICRGCLERIDDLRTGVCPCARRGDPACSEPIVRWERLVEIHGRSEVINSGLLGIWDAIRAEGAIKGNKEASDI
jgi:hypothetical protein